jgi:hypothetical protein
MIISIESFLDKISPEEEIKILSILTCASDTKKKNKKMMSRKNTFIA